VGVFETGEWPVARGLWKPAFVPFPTSHLLPPTTYSPPTTYYAPRTKYNSHTYLPHPTSHFLTNNPPPAHGRLPRWGR